MTQCIIIGSGILGSTTAYRLAKSGVDVTLIDKHVEGKATSAAAGIICPWLTKRRNKAWYHLATEGARLYPKLVEELNSDGEIHTGYAHVGALKLHNKDDELMDAYHRGMKQIKDIPEIGRLEILDHDDINQLIPLIDEEYHAIHITGAARVDGKLMNEALINGAINHGAKIIHGKATIQHDSDHEVSVLVNGHTLKADTIVCTTGAWMKETLHPLGMTFKSRPQRGQILHLKSPGLDLKEWPVVMPPNNLSIVPFGEHLVIGSTHENNAGFNTQVTAGGIHEILDRALNVIPKLANWSLLETRVGFRPMTPDSMPVIGSLPGYENIFIGNGLGASGLTTGPYVGEQLARLVLGQELQVNLTEYDVTSVIENK